VTSLSAKIRSQKVVVTTELTPPKGIALTDLFALKTAGLLRAAAASNAGRDMAGHELKSFAR